MTLKELDDYYQLEGAIRDCENKLREMEMVIYRSPQFDGVGSTPSPRNGIEDAYIRYVEKCAEIAAEKAEYERLKERVERYIGGIGDLFTRRIFEKRYFQRKPWQVVADELGGGNTRDGVRVIRDRYLKDHPDG